LLWIYLEQRSRTMKVMMSVCGDVVWMRMHAREEARQVIKRE
jgi:hypothetical protein